MAVSCRSPWECLSTGRFSIASPRVQVRLTWGAVGPPGGRDLTEGRREPTAVAGLNAGPTGPVHVGDLTSSLPHRAKVNVVLEQQPQ